MLHHDTRALEAFDTYRSTGGGALLGLLYDEADDHEASVLDDLLRRAGFTWEHPGCWTNPFYRDTCEQCQTARAEIDDEVEPPYRPTPEEEAAMAAERDAWAREDEQTYLDSLSDEIGYRDVLGG